MHDVKNIGASQLKLLIDQNSFFNQFIVQIGQENISTVPDISYEMNSPVHHEIDDSMVSNNIQDDFVFIKKWGKLAFKYNCALVPCMTNQHKYTSEFSKLLATEIPSPEVFRYANDIFQNPNRVQSYLEANFSLFNYKIEKIDDNCSIFYTDPLEMVSGLLSNSFIAEHVFFDTERKRYLDSFMDGSKYNRSSSNTLHFLFYYDDFNPLLNNLSSNASQYKCSSIYFKILNISPQLASKRSCVMPFMIFYSRDFKINKQQIFEFVTKKLANFAAKH